MNQNQNYLNILSVFHFVVAAIIAIVSCFPIIHLVVGISMLTDFGSTPSDPTVPQTVNLMFQLMPIIFIVVASMMILTGWAFAGAVAIAGLMLHRRRRHTYCLVMAGVECMFAPIGTVLGIFTILMLSKPEVRQLFNPTTGDSAALRVAS